MKRRGFLKALGLGGVAIVLPDVELKAEDVCGRCKGKGVTPIVVSPHPSLFNELQEMMGTTRTHFDYLPQPMFQEINVSVDGPCPECQKEAHDRWAQDLRDYPRKLLDLL